MKRFAAAFLALIICLSAVNAFAKVEKTELVYGKIDAVGQLTDLYIVNAFETQETETFTDYGTYSELTNLSDTNTIVNSQEGIALSLSPGRTYYQGKPVSQALPWRFAIGYSLDGREVSPSALSGASGSLTITLDVQVEEALRAFAEGSTLQISLSLDGDRCFDIDAPNGTLAFAGGNITLSYVVLPGQSASYALSCIVKDFAMPGIQIAGVRMAMDVEQYRNAFQEGMQGNPMADAMGPVMENLIAGMTPGEPQSFADPRNGIIRHLQFIILGEGIPEKEQPAPAKEAEDSAEETPISRILALFFQ